MELGEPPKVEVAASIFRELCYNYRDSLVAGILVAGWDKQKGGTFLSIYILTKTSQSRSGDTSISLNK